MINKIISNKAENQDCFSFQTTHGSLQGNDPTASSPLEGTGVTQLRLENSSHICVALEVMDLFQEGNTLTITLECLVDKMELA